MNLNDIVLQLNNQFNVDLIKEDNNLIIYDMDGYELIKLTKEDTLNIIGELYHLMEE